MSEFAHSQVKTGYEIVLTIQLTYHVFLHWSVRKPCGSFSIEHFCNGWISIKKLNRTKLAIIEEAEKTTQRYNQLTHWMNT